MYTRHTLEILKPCLILDDVSETVSVCDSDDRDYQFIQQNSIEDDNTEHTVSSFSALPSLFGKSLCVEEDGSPMNNMEECGSMDGAEREDLDREENMLIGDIYDDRILENFR